MRVMIFAVFISLLPGLSAISTQAQTETIAKAEVFAGFLHKRNGDSGFNGVNISGVYNFSKYFGAKVDYSYSAGPEYFPYGRQTERTVMAGLQIKNSTKERNKVRPFLHGLIGSSRQTLFGPKTNAFTFAVGGGLDVRVSERVSIRVIQADFQPTYHNSITRAQARFSFGIVLD